MTNQTISGCEWIVEAHGCDPRSLADRDALARLFDRIIAGMRLHPVAPTAWHQFPGSDGNAGGITGLTLLSESHLAIHTFPEFGSLCLNVFCCRTRPDWDFAAELEHIFAATSVEVRKIERPYGVATQAGALVETA